VGSPWHWKDAQPCQKWDQDSKVCYGTCTNLAQLGRKPSGVLLGAIFCEEFFYEIFECYVWYFFPGTISHTMTPCTGFPFFLNFFEPHLAEFQI
jgi:hypothetical protein